MKKSPITLLGAFVAIILLIFFIVTNNDSFNNSLACSNLELFKSKKIKGVVEQKYIDQKNHNAPTIKLNSDHTIILPMDTNSFYNFVELGDSVAKEIDSDAINVYRNDRAHSFKIDFGCDD